jgi:hypothetical protein
MNDGSGGLWGSSERVNLAQPLAELVPIAKIRVTTLFHQHFQTAPST